MTKTPNIYYFDPTCEMAIANGTVSWRPSQFLQQFEIDLGILPAFFAETSDVVLVNELPSDVFLQTLRNAGFPAPKFQLFEQAVKDASFIELAKNELRPWGWSPMILHRFKPLIHSCSDDFKTSLVSVWKEEYKHFYSRRFSFEVLTNIIEKANDPQLLTKMDFPVICSNIQDVVESHVRFQKSMLKAPWSSSGRGVLPVRFPELNASILNWSKGVIKNQGYLMCEPLLDKVADFSFQFEIRHGKVNYLGNTWFITGEKGQYKGHYLKSVSEICSDEVSSLFLLKEELLVGLLNEQLLVRLASSYKGYLGVDAMVIRDETGKLLIHPCLEINLRYNMGLLSMRLKEIFGESYSVFEIALLDSKADLKDKLLLTPITSKTKYVAWLK